MSTWRQGWIHVGRTYHGTEGRRTVMRIRDNHGRHVGACGPLADCVVTYIDGTDTDRCGAMAFVRWRDGDVDAPTWGLA